MTFLWIQKQILSGLSFQLDPNQFTFCASRGAENMLLVMLNNIYEHLDKANSLEKIL